MAETRPLPPVWLMGLSVLPGGAYGGVMFTAIPQLLAGAHVPEPQIAALTATAMIPGFSAFLLSPLLDWRFRRRTYAVSFGGLMVLCLVGALLSTGNLLLVTVLLFAGCLSAQFSSMSLGGWFGSLVETEQKGTLGAWFAVGNVGGGGLIMLVAVGLMRALPSPLGAVAIGLIAAAPVPILFMVPCPPADRRIATEGFRGFARDLAALLRKSSVLWTVLLFVLPAASFALTNALGGLGTDFHSSERIVSLLSGAGLTVAAVVGSLTIPLLSKKIAPRPLYLMIGGFGAIFTLFLVASPHTPMTFALAILGQNVFQAAAFATENMITLRTIGPNNPLAATQFGLLGATANLPIAYMQYLDGRGYAAGGVNGSLLTDALISGAAVLVLTAVLWNWRNRVPAI